MSMSVRKAAAAALMLVCVQLALAGEGKWTVDGPEGGPVYMLQENYTTSTLYAEVGWGGNTIFQSEDGGATWTVFLRPDWSGITYDFAVAQTSTPEVIGLMPGAYIYDSTGQILDLLYESTGTNITDPYTTAVSPDGQTIYLGGRYHGIAVSTDGGHSFAIKSSGLPTTATGYALVDQIVVNPDTPTTAYAVILGSGVYRTVDGGSTWTQFDTNLPSSFSGRLYVDPFNPAKVFAYRADNHIYMSDSGAAWSSVASPTNSIGAMTVAPNSPSTMYAFGLLGLLYNSTDEGSTWTSVGQVFPTSRTPRYMIAVGGSTPTLIAATDVGLWRSTDGGVTWSRANTGFIGTYVHDISQSAADPSQIVVSTEKMGLFYSVDSGKSFAASAGTEDVKGDAIARSAIDPTEVFASVNNAVSKSSDGGKTFTSVTLKADDALSIDPIDPNNILGGTTGTGVDATTDGATSWTYSNTGLTGNEDVRSIVMDPRDPKTVYLATYNHGLFKSMDQGASWSAMGPSGLSATVLVENPHNPDQLYVGTLNNGFYRSDDAGATWFELGFSFGGNIGPWIEDLAFDPDNEHVMYVVGELSPYRTVDDGATWQQLSAATLPYHGSDITDAVMVDRADHSRILVSDRYTGLIEYTTAVDLQATGSTPATLAPGDKGMLSYTVSNKSDLDSADVQATIDVDANLTISSATPGAGSCSVAGNVISCDLGALSGHASTTISVIVSADTEGSYDSTLAATPYEHELNTSDNSAVLTASIVAPTSGGSTGGGSTGGSSSGGTSTSGSSGGGGVLGLWVLLGLSGLALRRRC